MYIHCIFENHNQTLHNTTIIYSNTYVYIFKIKLLRTYEYICVAENNCGMVEKNSILSPSQFEKFYFYQSKVQTSIEENLSVRSFQIKSF